MESLILGNKALQAAEEYVLGLFHMYFSVYFHKATRSAEKMVAAALQRIGQLLQEDKADLCGLADKHPLVRFLRDQSLASYLGLDDTVVWAALGETASARDSIVAELSKRLQRRELFKAIDITARLDHRGGAASVARFRARLKELRKEVGEFDILEDQATRNPYKRRGYDSPEALSKVLIRRIDGTGYEDLDERSDVVAALQQQSTFRVYVRNDEMKERVRADSRGYRKMTTPEDASDIVAAAGGELAGRTRLQKSGYLLEVAGVGAGFDFSYHYYGPYSEELAIAAADAAALRFLSVEPARSQSGLPYEIFRTTRAHSETDSSRLERRQTILAILDRYDSISLELAATAHYLSENGFGQDPWTETKKRKSGKATEDRVRKAKQVLGDVGFAELSKR